MKKIIATFFSVVLLIGAVGCHSADPDGGLISRIRSGSSDESEVISLADPSKLENATSVYELTDLMTTNYDKEKYSECDDDEDLLFYFDILGYKEYITVEHNGEKYLLFMYRFDSYTSIGQFINGIEKKPVGDTLNINIDVETKESKTQGCFPNMTFFRMIIKLEKDFPTIVVSGSEYTEYNGGKIYIGGKCGMADKDLNITVPLIYDEIYDYCYYGDRDTTDLPTLYRVYINDQGNGLLDEDLNLIISPKYYNIHVVDKDTFIAMTLKSGDEQNNHIFLLDKNENIIKTIDGFVDDDSSGAMYCHEGHLKYSINKPDMSIDCIGVIDEDLNVIIEPKYVNVFQTDGGYKVTDIDGKEALFDMDGNQITDFN